MAITISGDGITSANIADGTITNADINASAAIDASKLTGTGKVLQVQSNFVTSAIALNTTSYQSVISKAITPVATGSTFIIYTVLDGVYKDATSNYIRGKLNRTGGFGGASFIGSATLYDHHGTYGMSTSAFDLGTLTHVSHDNPSYSSGDTLTYELAVRRFDGSGTITVNKWNNGLTQILIMEIGA